MFDNDGVFNLASGVTLNAGDNSTTAKQTSGTTTVATGANLSINGTGHPFKLNGGTMNGSGTVTGSVTNSGGTVAPGASPGTLTLSGDYTQGAGCTLQIPVNGTSAGQFSMLSVGGNPTLGGRLALQPSAGYAASSAPGDNVGLLTYGGSRTGPFATTTVNPPLSDGKPFTPNYVDGSKRVDAVVGNPAAPANTGLPAIGGTAMEGQTLSTTNGSWNNHPSSFAYQWRDRDGAGNNCTNVGTNINSYTLSAGDVGRTVRVIVTATNAGGSVPASSAHTGIVAAKGIPPTPPPQLSGVGLSAKSFLAKKGTTLALTLSEPATVKVVIIQNVSGRKVNGRCKPGAKKGKPCKVTCKRRTLTFSGAIGVNQLKLRTKGLKPGSYKLTVTAIDGIGQTSNAVTLSFKIKKPPKKH